MPKRVLIADDNPMMRSFIRSVLERQQNFEVCGEAVDGIEAIEKAGELHPDLIILDLSMPRMHGLEAGHRLKALMPSVRLILFTMHKDMIRAADAGYAGVSAVISKTEGMDVLQREVQSLLSAP